jgi:hypothetical protein
MLSARILASDVKNRRQGFEIEQDVYYNFLGVRRLFASFFSEVFGLKKSISVPGKTERLTDTARPT